MAEPVQFRRYVLGPEKGQDWAIFVIGSDGYFSAVSDRGDVAHQWPNGGGKGIDFRLFLAGVEREWEYFVRKLFPRELYDPEATLLAAKKLILERRRSRSVTRTQAREEWGLLGDHDDLGDELCWYKWHDDPDHVLLDEEDTVSCRASCYDRDGVVFVRKIMIRLAAVLKRELAQSTAWNAVCYPGGPGHPLDVPAGSPVDDPLSLEQLAELKLTWCPPPDLGGKLEKVFALAERALTASRRVCGTCEMSSHADPETGLVPCCGVMRGKLDYCSSWTPITAPVTIGHRR